MALSTVRCIGLVPDLVICHNWRLMPSFFAKAVLLSFISFCKLIKTSRRLIATVMLFMTTIVALVCAESQRRREIVRTNNTIVATC